MKTHSSLVSDRSIKVSPKMNREYYDELYAVQSLYEGSIFSMETALYINMFIPVIPKKFHLSFAYYYKKNYKFRNHMEFYYVLDEKVNIGLKHGLTAYGHEIYYYDLERSLCDILSRDINNMYRYFDLFYQYQHYPYKDVKRLSCYADMLNLTEEIAYLGFI